MAIEGGISRVTLLASLALFVSVCSAEERHLRVIDKDTGQGLAEVVIVLRWDRLAKDGVRASYTPCVRIETRQSSANGRFTIPVGDNAPSVAAIYKRGYSHIPDSVAAARDVAVMRRFSGALPERSMEYREIYAATACPLEVRTGLAPLYKAIYDEARGLVSTAVDAAIAEDFLGQVELTTLPKEEALKRARERYDRQNAARKAREASP